MASTIMGSPNGTTTTDQQGKPGAGGPDILLIGIVMAMSAIVVILMVILITICYRRKMRRQQISKDGESDIVLTVFPEQRHSGVSLRNEGFRRDTTDITGNVTHEDEISAAPKQKCVTYANVTELYPEPTEDYINVQFKLPAGEDTYVNFSGGIETQNGSNATKIPSKSPNITPRPSDAGDRPIRSPRHSDAGQRPPMVSPRPPHTITGSSVPVKLDSDVENDMTTPERLCDSPELPKIRGRRSRDAGQSTGLPLLADKDTTMKRASNIFRSDTKAYQFYINTIRSYEMTRDQINCDQRVGRGHFGHVYGGTATKLPNSKKRNANIAVKIMKSSAPDSDKQEFLYELEIMKLVNSVNHENIVQLLGCVTKSQPYMIVLELMTNGNLQKFLRDTRSKDVYYNLFGNSDSLTERHLLKFAKDIAKGMEGLADLQLLHRDLAARNILLDENLTCKVADFGFAKDVLNKPEYKSKSVFQRPRPTRWLAPESLFTFKHSIRSDVWSYGVVLWEIVTLGNLPYPGMSTREVMSAIAKGYRMTCPRHCSPDIYRIMAACWEEHPFDRPPFSELVAKVTELHGSVNGDLIDIEKITEDDYIDTLPPQEQEILLEYAASETLC